MKTIVVGCGRLGAELAYRLYKRGQEVTIIDQVEASFNYMKPDFQGRMIEGDALNRDVLHRAGIREAEALASVTNSDAVNAVVGHVARTVYNIPNVVVRNYIPNLRPIFEIFELQVISSAMWAAQRLEEMIYHMEARSVFSAGNGEVEIYQMAIPAAWNGRKVKDLVSSKECVAVSITKIGIASLPTDDTLLKEGDVLHVSSTFDGIESLRSKLFAKSKKKEA